MMGIGDERYEERVLGETSRRYLAAHFCKSVLWHASGLLFAFFLTETCGLPPRTMGALIAVSLFVNAVSDILIGREVRIAVRRPAILLRRQCDAAGPAGLFFLLFCMTPFLPVQIRFGAALVMLVGFRIAFARMDVPQNALVPMLAPDPASQMRMLAARNIFSGSASLLVATVAAPLLLSTGCSALPLVGWAAVVAGLAVVSAHRLARGRDIAPRLKPEAGHRSEGGAAPALLVLFVACTATAGSTVFRAMEPYAVAYGGAGISIMIWASLGAILCQPCWTIAGRRLSPNVLPLLAAGCVIVAALALTGLSRASGIAAAVAGLGFGIGSGGLWLMVWTAAIRGDDQQSNLQRIASLTAVSKAAQGLAMLSLGQALHNAPYRSVLTTSGALRSLTMIAPLLLLTLGCLLLALGERRISRTVRGAGPATPPPVAQTAQDQATPPSAGLAAPAPRAATAG